MLLLREFRDTANDRNFLGICLGMQLLFSSSEEFQFTEGLNLIEGKIKMQDGKIIGEPTGKPLSFK